MNSRAMNLRWLAARMGCVLGCLGLFAALRCEAQTNLVPNPGFELPEDSCSWQCCFNVGSRPLHWYSWMNSPDHFNACAGGDGGYDSLVSVPHNGWSFQYPWEGDAYAGVRTYDGGEDYREYMGAALLEPLVPGCSYQLRFRTNPAYGGTYWLPNGGGVCNNVGMLLITVSNAWPGISGPPFEFRNFAHLRTTVPVVDTVAWTLVEGTIVADSAYAYVVLGNFFTDALTNGYANGGSWTDITYYLFDGVEVVPLDVGCHGTGLADLEQGGPKVDLGNGVVTVRWDAPIQVTVSDPIGRMCQRVSGETGSAQVQLPTGKGLYVLQVESKGRSFVQKFVWP